MATVMFRLYVRSEVEGEKGVGGLGRPEQCLLLERGEERGQREEEESTEKYGRYRSRLGRREGGRLPEHDQHAGTWHDLLTVPA